MQCLPHTSVINLLQGSFGLSTLEELELAIENCKQLVLQAPSRSDRKKALTHKLIQLRLKLSEAKVGIPGKSCKTIAVIKKLTIFKFSIKLRHCTWEVSKLRVCKSEGPRYLRNKAFKVSCLHVNFIMFITRVNPSVCC